MISYDHRKTNRIPILKKDRSSIIGSSLMFTFCDMVVGVVESNPIQCDVTGAGSPLCPHLK